jgi:hypothetical protein
VYSGDSTTPLASQLVSGVNTGTGVSYVQVGLLSSLSSNIGTTIGIDDMEFGTSGWFGAAG